MYLGTAELRHMPSQKRCRPESERTKESAGDGMLLPCMQHAHAAAHFPAGVSSQPRRALNGGASNLQLPCTQDLPLAARLLLGCEHAQAARTACMHLQGGQRL